jgi:acetate kinase
MKALIVNCGSSSIKCCLYTFTHLPESFIPPDWETHITWKNTSSQIPDLQGILPFTKSDKIECIAHRFVHGGQKYRESVFINAEVKQDLRLLLPLAPLHTNRSLAVVEAIETHFPQAPQIAIFDTAFHTTLPQAAFTYPGPYTWLQKGVRRYGFHGISFQYCIAQVTKILGSTPQKMVLCHLGSGASLCAAYEGKSIDTTMGFTPLEGLMMDTRSGSIDPGILLYLLKEKSLSELKQELYEKSGLLGLSGISSDMRDILERAQKNNRRAKLALDVYIHRLLSSIGSMIASLGGIDALVFTGGIGENASFIRKEVCQRLGFLGINATRDGERKNDCVISSKDSAVKVLVIHTQEAFEMAKECWKLLAFSGKKY